MDEMICAGGGPRRSGKVRERGRLGSIAGCCTVASEAAVAYAVLGLLLAPTGVDASRAALVGPGLLAGSFAGQRLLIWLGLRSIMRRLIVVLSGSVAVLLALKVALLADYGLVDTAWVTAPWRDLVQIFTAFPFALSLLLAAAFAWWRGSWLGARPFAFQTTAISFQAGITALLVAYCIAALTANAVPHAALATLAFFFWGLLGVALAHRQHIAGRDVGKPDGSWLLLLFGSALLASAAGVLVGVYFDDRVIQLLLALIRLVGHLLGALLSFLAQLIPPTPAGDVPSLTPFAVPSGKQVNEGPLFEIPEAVREFLRWFWAMLIVGLSAAAVLRVISDIVLYLFRSATTGGGTVETVEDGWLNDLRAPLRALARALRALVEYFQWMIHRWRRQPIGAPSPLARAVRETYRDLLYWAAKRGLPRAPRETPYEYLQRLCLALPACEADLGVLTDSYVRARYCPHLLTEEERRSAEDACRRLRRLRRR